MRNPATIGFKMQCSYMTQLWVTAETWLRLVWDDEHDGVDWGIIKVDALDPSLLEQSVHMKKWDYGKPV